MKKFFVIGVLAIAGACSSLSKQRKPSSVGGPLTFEAMVTTLRDTKAATVDEAVETLTTNYPEHFKYYTLMYRSLSLHESSYLEPRVIAFGTNANFVVTFNGGPEKGGGYALETMEFDGRDYHFREVAFKKEKPATEALPLTDIAFQDERMVISKSNPQRCTQCHGEAPHPIWETYFFWPGAYGSEDDLPNTAYNRQERDTNPNYAGDLQHSKASLGRSLRLKPGAPDREVAGFTQYLKGKSTHRRYKHLPLRPIDQSYLDLAPLKSPADYDWGSNRPNLRLTVHLYNQSSARLDQKLKEDPTLRGLRELYYHLKWCVGSNPNFQTWMDRWKDPSIMFIGIPIARNLAGRAGAWNLFLKDFLQAELGMEAEKVGHILSDFGAQNVENAGSFGPERPSAAGYRKLSVKLPTHAEFVVNKESDSLYWEATFAYLARAFGLDLTPYTINMRRVHTFREGGFRPLFEQGLNYFGLERVDRRQLEKACGESRRRLEKMKP